ncbi:hypothetical protein BH23VER1_BH23VER1_14640 [soil metagenome]
MNPVATIALASAAAVAGWLVPQPVAPPPDREQGTTASPSVPEARVAPSSTLERVLAEALHQFPSAPLDGVAALAPFVAAHPVGGLESFASNVSPNLRRGSYPRAFAYYAALDTLLEQDPAAFLRAVRASSEMFDGSSIAFFVPPGTDPDSAIEIESLATTYGEPTPEEVAQLVNLLAGGKPENFIPAEEDSFPDNVIGRFESWVAEENANPFSDFEALREQWVENEGAATWEIARQSPVLAGHSLFMEGLMRTIIKHDPIAALAILRDPTKHPFGGGPAFGSTLPDLAADLSTDVPSATLEWALTDIPDKSFRDAIFAEIFNNVGRGAPADGVAFFRAGIDIPRELRHELLADFAAGWLHRDEDAALAWTLALEGSDRLPALSTLHSVGDLFGTLEAVRQLHPDIFPSVLPQYAARLARTDPERFARLAADISEASVAVASGRIDYRDFAPAAEILAASDLRSEPAREAALTLVDRWVHADPDATADWVAALPGGSARDSLTRRIASRLAGRDPALAERWLATLPPDAIPPDAYLGLAEGTVAYDPSAALAWAARLANPNKLTTFIRENMLALAYSAPDETRTFISENIPDPDDRDEFLTLIATEQAWQTYLSAP